MYGIVPRPTAQEFMTPSYHGDHAYSVWGVFLLWDRRQHTGQSISFCGVWNWKLKMEKKRQEGKRALDFPFMPKWVDCSVDSIPFCLLEKAGPFLKGNCQLSPRFGKKYLFVDLFFLYYLHTSQPLPLYLWFLILNFFPNFFLCSLSRHIVRQAHDFRKKLRSIFWF